VYTCSRRMEILASCDHSSRARSCALVVPLAAAFARQSEHVMCTLLPFHSKAAGAVAVASASRRFGAHLAWFMVHSRCSHHWWLHGSHTNQLSRQVMHARAHIYSLAKVEELSCADT
jgi:hypothetical protein